MNRLLIGLVILMACSALAQGPTVWVASPWQHVTRDTPSGAATEATLEAAANEYEAFRVIVTAGADALTGVNLVATDLTGNVGTIPAANVTLYREHYIDVFKPSYRSTAQPGWYPDPLIPFVDPATGGEPAAATYDAVPASVEAGRNQGFWADVYVPAGTVAGEYTGAVVVTAGDQELARVPVRLTVWPFALPDTIAMQSNFGGLGGRVAQGHGVAAGSPEAAEVEDRYIDTLLAHRAIPSSLGNVWPKWTEGQGMDDSATGERLRTMIEERHVNALNIPFAHRDKPDTCRAYLKDLAAYLREKGWLDLGYIYLRDEPNDAEEYETVRQQGALIASADPGIGRMCTEQTITSNPEWGDLYGAVDIWCPLWGLWDEKTAQERQALGERMWSYTALCQCSDKNPYWQIDFPPVSFRAPFWVSRHYGIEGFLYWSSVYWPPEKDPWTRPHFRDNYWGEGMLLYPGTPAGLKGPVTSIRLKLVREALEDYEYMALADKAGAQERVSEIVAGIATNFQNWSREPEAYTNARRDLAQLCADAATQ